MEAHQLHDILLKELLPKIDLMVVDFVIANIESDAEKTNFVMLLFINLLANSVIRTSERGHLAANLESIKKAVELSFRDILNQVESEEKEELH